MAELGFVAGVGMIVAFLTSITMLPALLMLLNPGGEAGRCRFCSPETVDDYMARNRKTVLRIAALAGTGALMLTVLLRFDSNPLDLRSPKVESVSTLFDLMKGPADLTQHHQCNRADASRGGCAGRAPGQAAAGGAGPDPVELCSRRPGQENWR